MPILSVKPGRSLVGVLLLLLCFCHNAWGASGAVEVRRLGLSKVGQNTLLTVVLDGAASPLVTTRKVEGKPQLVVDFPQARAGRLPTHLEGDESLVQQVITESTSARGGVRIILDLYPERPYVYWQKSRPGSAGQTFFILGLNPDLKAPPVQARIAKPPAQEAAAPTPEPRAEVQERETIPEPPTAPEPPEPGASEYGSRAPQSNVAPGSFAELRNLMPKAANLFQGLETDGWRVAESRRYDRPGTRFSRDFIITNNRYPELAVKVAYLPANVPNTPNISIIMLATDNLQSQTASEYQSLRQWNFAKIKTKYEDIGDFFDDALKPLRVKLRQETQALALRDAAVFQNFLKLACPSDPQVIDKVMKHIREKVSPRFEGVQYTVSERPLVFLNLVDFLYIKVYYVDSGPH
jgi:hypothetical protein